jgi:RNA polymerase sigma-70 factor (ECF subfamily)
MLLLQRLAQGDDTALTAFYNATNTLVYSLALRLVRNQQAAEDVTIEVYMQVQRQAAQYDRRRGTPSAWLVTLTRSRAIDRIRAESTRQQREEPLENALLIPSATPTPEEEGIAAELHQAVQNALAALIPEQRQVIEIAFYVGLSHREIAAQLGHPLGTVKTRLRTGLMALSTLLQHVVREE